MTDIASLGIKIDTSDVAKAERDLDQLNQAGKSSEDSAKRVGSAWEQAAGKISGDTGEIVRQLREMSKAQTATVAALNKLDQSVNKFGSGAAVAAEKIKTVSNAAGDLAKRERESASGFKVGNESIEQQRQALERLIGQIDPVTAALSRLDAQQKELASFKSAGLIDEAAFAEYQGKIDAARTSLNAARNTMVQTGNSAKQTAFALRQLPAQFSDIAVSLQGGMNPFTVLLQQGSQIRDSFGGIGPALRETGRYALGLVNPFTIAAAAVAALTLAYKQGSDEQSAYNRALILTGNYAGASSEALEGMARRLDATTTGTQRQAARALAEIASSGRFAASQFDGIAAAAINMENATGKAVSETIDEFVRLADSPTQAIEQLNKSQKFLTAEIYGQISALEAQSRTAEAAALAIETYNNALTGRAGEVVQRLGYIESAWDSVKKGAAEAWDEILGIGRQRTSDDRLEDLQRQLKGVADGYSVALAALGPLGVAYDAFRRMTRNAAEIQGEIDQIVGQQNQAKFIDEFLADIKRAEDSAIKAVGRIDALGRSVETNAEKRKRALEQLERDIEAIRKTNAADERLAPENVQRLRIGIENQFADPKPERQQEFRDDAGTRMLQTLRQQEAALQEQLETEKKLTDAQRERAKFEQLIADLKNKGTLTADQKSLQANQEAIRAQLDKNVAIAEEVRLRTQAAKEAKKLAAFDQAVAAQTQSAREAYQLQAASVGLGREQAQRLQERIRLEQQFNRQQAQLLEQRNAGTISDDLYAKETAILENALAERLSMQQDYYRQLEEAQGNWVNGATAALQDYQDRAQNTSAQAYDIIGGSLEELTQGFSRAAAQSILWGNDFEESMRRVGASILENVVGGLIEMGARLLINAAIGETIAATSTAANVGLAATTAAAWAPAAAAVSLASFGANAAPATAGMTSTYATAQALSVVGGFEKGGFTGNIDRKKVAGVVHGQEYVFDAASTKRIGVENLEKLRSGREAVAASASVARNSTSTDKQIEMLTKRIERMRPVQNFNISTPNADSFRASERQITRRARQRVAS